MKDEDPNPLVLVVGANGQVGWELQRLAHEQSLRLRGLTHRELDIADRSAVTEVLGSVRPDVVINAAAYTAVDRAEEEREQAYRVNRDGAAHLAAAASAVGARLIQISTDFVFDGARSTPYRPEDEPNPLGAYGASKLEGEQRCLEITQGEALVLRTAWVYCAHGQNFVKTMLRLMRERDTLSVVEDQVGTPSWARNLADVIHLTLDHPQMKGVYHWTDAGVASWYDFALAIQEEALGLGLLERAIPIDPIPSSDYPTPAARPAFSVLDKSATRRVLGISGVHWRVALRGMMGELGGIVD